MQKVLPFTRIQEASPYMEAQVFNYINEGQIESFESFENFDLLAFDWYDVQREEPEAGKILLYLDREDLFIFCEQDETERQAAAMTAELTAAGEVSNELLLTRFFTRLLRGDWGWLDAMEDQVGELEDTLLTSAPRETLGKIIQWRGELLRLRRCYVQLEAIFDEMLANENELLSEAALRRLTILHSRTARCLTAAGSLHEAVGQLREAYQSQLSIQQNDLMKVFTVVTTVFLPLTLITGWYGMNFIHMPELHWRLAYPAVFLLCVGIAVGLLWFFRKKKWF